MTYSCLVLKTEVFSLQFMLNFYVIALACNVLLPKDFDVTSLIEVLTQL